MAHESEFWELGLGQDSGDQGGQIHDTHLSNVPIPHPGVGVVEHLVLRVETAAVVAEPDIVAGFG